jgi:hypothetical protein
MSKKTIIYSLSLILFLNVVGCGTLMHPERRGQRVNKVSRLDVGIVVLDAVGLLFFLVPGVIAFAADISNNTIYLPSSRHAGLYEKVKFSGEANNENFALALGEKLNMTINPNIIVSK